MYETAPYFYGTGRRKSSVARVRIYQGTGKITINDRDIDDYFGLDTLKSLSVSPSPSPATRASSTSSAAWPAAASPASRRHPSRRGPRPAPVRQREPPLRAEEGWVPHPRPQNEGAEEVRPQSRSSRSAVQQALNFIKSGQKPGTTRFPGFFLFKWFDAI